MEKKVIDKRSLKTRKVLKDTLTDLMAEKKIENITIKDLTDKADLNRSTFYLHYCDIYDLLEQIECDLLKNINDIISEFDPETFTKYCSGHKPHPHLVKLFEYLLKNKKIGNALLGPNGDISFLKKFTNIFIKQAETWISIYNVNDADVSKYVLDYSISGFIGIIKRWFQDDSHIPPTEIANITIKILINGLNANNYI